MGCNRVMCLGLSWAAHNPLKQIPSASGISPFLGDLTNIWWVFWSHHFMANRWGNNGNSDRLYFLGSKITADGDCSHEIKRCLLLGRKIMANLDSILKSRDITLPTRVHLVKAMVFPVVMYGYES